MSNNNLRRNILAVLAPCLAFIFGICFYQDTYAALAATDSQLYELSLLSGLQQCYKTGIKDEIQVSDFSGLNSILSKPNNKVYITTHIGNSLSGNSDNDLKCSEVINGYKADKASNSAKGIKQILKDASTPEEAGYKFVQSASEGNTVKITMNDFQGNASRNKVTFDGDIEISNADSSGATCAGQINAYYNGATTAFATVLCPNGDTIIAGGPTQAPYDQIYPYMRSNDEIKDEIMTNFTTFVYNYSEGDNYPFILDDNELGGSMKPVDNADGNSQMAIYKPISDGSSASGIALKKIGASNNIPGCSNGGLSTGGETYDTVSCSFSDSLTYALYYRYVQNNDGLQIQECSANKAEGAAYYVKNSANTWCTIAVTDSSALSDSYSVVDGIRLADGNMQTVLNWLSDENSYKYISEEKYADATINDDGTVTPPPASDTDVSATDTDPCYSGDIESMSWILCPTTKNMAKATDGLNSMIEDMLAVDVDLYAQISPNGEESGTRTAWGYFRDIANIILIIVFLVVIFSQLSGIGIDNYGIKKILPKLIVSAVLINLSYIICTLAIDLSNILGSSLNLLLQSIGKTIGVENYGQITISTLVTGILGAVTAVGAGASIALEGITLLGTSGATTMVLIIPLIIALIIAIVAVVMFYVMLGARMIIIILFTALSPLAFACNILPNTQKIFKKWLDVMKAALLMFPICGALYGLSFIIKAIVFSSDGIHIWMGIVAVFSPFLPFLVLPTLLRSAISALGVVGNKLMGIGDTMKGSLKNAQSAVRNSEQYRTQARLGQLEHANWRAHRTLEGTKGIGKNRHLFARTGLNNITGRDLTKSEQARKLEAQKAINTYEAEMADAAVGVPVVDNETAMMRARSRLQAQETKNWSEQFARANSATIEAAFTDALSHGNVAKASAAFAALKDTGNLPKIHNALMSANWSAMSSEMRLNLNQDMIKSGDVSMKAYAKRSFAKDNQGDFAKFMRGEDQGIAEFGTLSSELNKLGPHAFDGQDKDSIEFITKRIAEQSDGGASLHNAGLAKMIMSGITSTQNGEERSRFVDMMKEYREKVGADQFKQAFGDAVTAAQLAKMDSSAYDALNFDGHANEMLASAIREIQQPNNATLYASMSNAVKTKIGVPTSQGSPSGSTIVDSHGRPISSQGNNGNNNSGGIILP